MRDILVTLAEEHCVAGREKPSPNGDSNGEQQGDGAFHGDRFKCSNFAKQGDRQSTKAAQHVDSRAPVRTIKSLLRG